MRKIIIFFILCVCTKLYGAYDETVLKDMGTNTPLGTENPGILDDKMRQLSRLLEIQYHERLLTVSGTATTADTFIIGSSSSGILCALPSATSVANGTTTKLYVIKNRGAGTITLSPTVDGIGSPTVSQNRAMMLFTNGTSWFEIKSENAGDAESLGGLFPSQYARSGANSDITAITGLTTYLAVGQGGSGTNTAAGAASAFGVGTEDSPTLTGLNVTSIGTVTTLNSTTGNVTNLATTTGTVTTLYSTTGNITNQVTTTGTITTLNSTTGNVTNLVTTTGTVTTLNSTTSNITTGNITNQVTTTGTVTTLNSTTGNVTNLVTTTGTVTTLNSTTGNITNQVTTTGTITTLNNTNLTTTTGTITTLNNTNFSGGSGTFTGNVQAARATGFDFLKQWTVGSTVGTGNVTFVESTGIDLAATYSNGVGTITITGVGTSSAGGWTNTGTQTIGLAGDQVLPGGTLTIHADYGMTGVLDRDIPNTITLDNLTQITTRNYSALTGTSTISPTTATITTAVITNLTATTATTTTAVITNATITNGTITNAYGIGFDDIAGLPSANTELAKFLGVDTLLLPGTTTTLSGTSSSQRVYNLIRSTLVTTTPPAGTDLYLKFEETGSPPTFTDSSGGTRTVTSNWYVAGTSSGKFDRGALFGTSTGSCSLADNDVWTPAGNFFCRFWWAPLNTTNSAGLVGHYSADGGIRIMFNPSDNQGIQLYIQSNGGGTIVNISEGSDTNWATGTARFVEVSRSGDDYFLFVGGTIVGSATTSSVWFNPTNPFYVGDGGNWSSDSANGVIDDFIWNDGTAGHTSNYTAPTQSEDYDVTYTYNTFQIIPPGTTTAFMTIVDDGTYSNRPKLVLGNPFSTSSVYGLDMAAYNLIAKSLIVAPSSSKVKTDLPSETSPQEEVLGIVRNSKAHKYLYKDKIVPAEIAESKAKGDYIHSQRASEFKLFKDLHENEYLEGVTGSMSVNYKRMMDAFEIDYQAKMNIKWNVLNDKRNRIIEAKAHLEKDPEDNRNNTANYGIEIDRDCPEEILNSDGLPVLEKWAGFNFTAIKGLVENLDKQRAEIGSLTVALENLRVINNLK